MYPDIRNYMYHYYGPRYMPYPSYGPYISYRPQYYYPRECKQCCWEDPVKQQSVCGWCCTDI